MADDLGYGDLGCYGNAEIKTPNLDNLAKEGIKFTNYHSNGAVCSPTRASLLTGLYPQEAGIVEVVTAKDHRDFGMSTEKYTIAKFLKSIGYKTAIIGKWHLGYAPEYGPNKHGFDHFEGFVSGNIDYFSHVDQEGYYDWWVNKCLQNEKGYLTGLIVDKGIEFLDKEKSDPFFLYLAHGAPHSPYQGPNDKPDRAVNGEFPIAGSREDVKVAYKEMVEYLDNGIGKLISYLKENGLLDNTFIIFCSDNGATRNAGTNFPYNGFKGQLYEGGHRVPGIVYWKNKISPGISEDLVLSMDIFPTIADLVNSPIQASISGQSFYKIFSGEKQKESKGRTVYWSYKNSKAAIKGNWKILKTEEGDFLFNLKDDPGESNSLSKIHPDKYEELNHSLVNWINKNNNP